MPSAFPICPSKQNLEVDENVLGMLESDARVGQVKPT